MDELLNLTLEAMIQECAAMGINTIEHAELIVDMYHDGFDSYEVKTVTTTLTFPNSRRTHGRCKLLGIQSP